MLGDRALDLGCEIAGVGGRVQLYVIDRHTALTQRVREVAHHRQHRTIFCS